MLEIATSTSQSPWINRASHGVKVGIGAALAGTLFSRMRLGCKLTLPLLGLSSCAFPIPFYMYALRSKLNEKHPALNYNRYLRTLWGPARNSQARTQLPLITGIEIACLAQLVATTRLARWVIMPFGLIALFPQCWALWKTASQNPGDIDGHLARWVNEPPSLI